MPGCPVFSVAYVRQMGGARPDYFNWIPNTPEGIPPAGVIMVLDSRYGGGAGHTGVCTGRADTSTYDLFQINDPYGSNARVKTYNYNGCLGWLVLKNKPTQPQADNEGIVQGDGLRGHTEPNLSAPVPWYFDDQEKSTLISKIKGENVQGKWGWTDWWYLAKGAGSPDVWVGDGFVLTTKNPANVPDYVKPVEPPKPTYSKPPTDTAVWGIDVSAHQGDIDWAKVREAGVDFAIIKTGHTGKSYGGVQPQNGDPKYRRNIEQCGIPYGSYWYGYPALDAKAEAKAFAETIKEVKNQGGVLFLDLEEREANSETWAIEFINEVEKLTGKPCHLYAYYDYYKSYPKLAELFIGTNRVLWLAHYGKQPGEALGVSPKPVIHQYSSSRTLEGIAGKVDLNIATISVVDFEKLGEHLSEQPTPEPKPPVQNPPDPNAPIDLSFLAKIIKAVIDFLSRLLGRKEK